MDRCDAGVTDPGHSAVNKAVEGIVGEHRGLAQGVDHGRTIAVFVVFIMGFVAQGVDDRGLPSAARAVFVFITRLVAVGVDGCDDTTDFVIIAGNNRAVGMDCIGQPLFAGLAPLLDSPGRPILADLNI